MKIFRYYIPINLLRVGVGCVVFGLAVLAFALSTSFGRSESLPLTRQQGGLPVNGWIICQDLGIGPVPGGPGNIQRFRLCQGSGWEVSAYCLEPAKPVPPLNALCSMVNATDFWCGDPVQQVREYQIEQTPVPTPQATATSLPSSTPTFTPTSTLTSIPTVAATSQQTATAPVGAGGVTLTPQATLFVRPHAGGPGNLLPLLSAGLIIAGIGLFLAAGRLARGRL
jgi:hypothetical protein